MSYTELHRPARRYPAPVEAGVLEIAAPPQAPMDRGSAVWQILVPMLGSFGIFGFAIVMGDKRYLIMAAILAGAMLLSGVAARIVQTKNLRRKHRQQVARYRQHLSKTEARLMAGAEQQRSANEVLYPSISDLWSVTVDRRRLWERRPDHEDFLSVRLGRGEVDPQLDAKLGGFDRNPLTEFDDEMLEAAEKLAAQHRKVENQPVVVDLSSTGCAAIVGPPESSRSLARSLITQLVTFRGPDDLKLVVWHRPEQQLDWSWAGLLPHSRLSNGPDDPAITTSVDDLRVIVNQLTKPRRELLEETDGVLAAKKRYRFTQVALVLDGYRPDDPIGQCEELTDLLADAARLGVTVLCLVDTPLAVPEKAMATIILQGGRASYFPTAASGTRHEGVQPDQCSLDRATNIARVLAPLRPRMASGTATAVDSAGLLDLLGITSLETISPEMWVQLDHADSLRTPIGLAEDGNPIYLDLKESSAGGQGPHGILIGATGSGKSELLRTLVLGLAARHAPEDLAMVLVDFKGGATFAKLDQLPHTAGMITNLERDPALIDRMQEALHGELERRQRVLHEAGGIDRADQYRAHRLAHPELALEPMPALLVVVDEFGELLASRPEFAELFLTIGRTGRSLGVHLLLSSQRLEEGRIRKLEGHLRYRLCLRTFTTDESRAVIGSSAAAELPPIPGVGFVGVDGTLEPFKAGLVSRQVRGLTGDSGRTPTEMDLILDRLGGPQTSHRRARPIWLEPLPVAHGLSTGVEPVAVDHEAWLAPTMGLRDDPRAQTLHPHRLHLTGTSGHVAVIGSPRSGKSTALQTMVCSLALTHDPFDMQVYAIDLGGGGLHQFETLPHVGAVLGRSHRQEVPRLIRQLRALIDARSDLFRDNGITDMAGFHKARHDGALTSELGEVVVVIDNWAVFSQEFDHLADEVLELVTGGLHYGIHVVVASARWQDIRMAMRDNIGGRFELRLNDPLDSEIDRRLAERLPSDIPGRALSPDGLQVQVFLPSVAPTTVGDEGLGSDSPDLVALIEERWSGRPVAPPVRMLPSHVTLEEAQASGASGAQGVTLGIEETMLGQWTVDLFGGEPHFLVLGDAESGKTNLLRTWMRQLTETFTPDEMLLAVVDRRRRLLREVPESHRLAVGWTPESIAQLANTVTSHLAGREVPDDLSVIAHEGPKIVLIVDDYDQVAGSNGNPLAPLTDWVIQGRDVGFHMVLARRVGGVTRSSFEPLYQRVKEMGTPGLVLSGDPSEGPILAGVKATTQPPGRGVAVGRGRAVEVQVAETKASADVRMITEERAKWA